MLVILNSLNAYNLPIFQQILMILVAKFMVHRAFSDETYLALGLLSPLMKVESIAEILNALFGFFKIDFFLKFFRSTIGLRSGLEPDQD